MPAGLKLCVIGMRIGTRGIYPRRRINNKSIIHRRTWDTNVHDFLYRVATVPRRLLSFAIFPPRERVFFNAPITRIGPRPFVRMPDDQIRIFKIDERENAARFEIF